MNFDIDFQALEWFVDKTTKNREGKLIAWIRVWLNILLKELKKNTPEDTKEMINSYKIIDVVKRWDQYVWVVGNTADHALYVEFGVDGRIYNYHKPKGSVFFKGIGNKTFQRSIVAVQDKIYQAIIQWLQR